MSMIRCPECGNSISDKAISCPKCGYALEKTKFCKFCGAKIPSDSVVCVKCGRQVENMAGKDGITINNVSNASSSASASATAAQQKMKELKEIDKKTALLLCIFLGYFGAHKFYEGKTGIGILYLFTAGLFGVGWIVDIFTILGKDDPYYV